MSTEMDPGTVASRLRHEFSQIDVPPGLATGTVVAAGRRRRRRLVTAGMAGIAVLTALAVGVPAALHARADRPDSTPADAEANLWNSCQPPEATAPKVSLPPDLAEAVVVPDQEWWKITIASERLKKAIDAKLHEVSPGITFDLVDDRGDGCNPYGWGGTFAYNLVRADGVKGAIQVSLIRDPGRPADRAADVVRTGRRQTDAGEKYAVPREVPAGRPRLQRALTSGMHAVLYPAGVDGWEIPVDVFAPDDLTVVVQGERYRGPTGEAGVKIPTMKPSESPLSFEQLLAIGTAVASVR